MSQTYYLVVVDASGIQQFVFNSNNLKHHLGASELVRQVTSDWVLEKLPAPNNMPKAETFWENKHIERGEVKVEVIYNGGGNTLILFAEQRLAKKFMRDLSLKALLKAPGLTVNMACCPFEWREQGADLGRAIEKLLGESLRPKKQRGSASGEMLGLAVTADCEFTGLPATSYTAQSREASQQRVSAQITAKLNCAEQANERLKKEIGEYDFVQNFDQFGSPGESSYMAVIHADGNRMGKRFAELAKKNLPNRDYISAVRALSRSLNIASREALRNTVSAIHKAWDKDNKIGGIVTVRERRLPFRPIIFGGDDATFICDGRMGLTVAAKYLEEFAKQTLEEPSGKTHPTARAGVAIVKTHYPFGQAYRLAEELAKNAKCFTKDGSRSAMDWHFGINGVVMGLEDIRKRDYIAADAGNMLMRPIQMDKTIGEWRDWAQFSGMVYEFNNGQKYPRSRIKAFREALREGTDSATAFINSYFKDREGNLTLPPIMNLDTKSGWIGTECAFFDAIEAMEFFAPLEPAK